MTDVSSMWSLNPCVVSCRWRDVRFSGLWWLLHCVWLCNLAVQTQLWNVIRASRPEERGLGTKSGLKAKTWSNPHPHTEEMCSHIYGSMRFSPSFQCIWMLLVWGIQSGQVPHKDFCMKINSKLWLSNLFKHTLYLNLSGRAKLLNAKYEEGIYF